MGSEAMVKKGKMNSESENDSEKRRKGKFKKVPKERRRRK
jgi:hypothetical protein